MFKKKTNPQTDAARLMENYCLLGLDVILTYM